MGTTEGNKGIVGKKAENNSIGSRKLAIGIVAIVAVLVIAAIILGSNPAKPGQRNSTTSSQANFNMTSYGTTVPQTNASNSTSDNAKVRFAGSNYSQIAHLIYGPNQTSIKFEAPGFNENIVNLSSGTVNVTFSKLGNVGLNSTFTVPKGYSLFYLEGSYGDDSVPTGEYSLSDDGVILVDSSGYVVGNVMSP